MRHIFSQKMSQKLWIAYETSSKTLLDKILTARSAKVVDFKGISGNILLNL